MSEDKERLAHDNEVIKPLYELKGYSRVIIPRTAEDKGDYFWIKPGRGKGRNINITKSKAKGIISEHRNFECWLPNEYIDKNSLRSYVQSK
jgi:hypothetical protein